MKTRMFLLIPLALFIPCLAADPPDLSGDWRLNSELSDDPAQKMKEARDAMRGGGGMEGGGMGRGRGRGGSGGRGGGAGRDPEEMCRRMEDLRG